MSVGREDLSEEVVALWGGEVPGTERIRAKGRMIAYSSEPMAVIELLDGTQLYWVASLCRPAKNGE